MVTRSAHADLEATYNVASVVERHPHLKWKVEELPPGQRWLHKDKPAKMAYAIVGGNREQKEKVMLIAMENAVAAKHLHPGGEITGTLEGALLDVVGGMPVTHIRGMPPIVHPAGSVHQPMADYWLGYCHQLQGSETTP